MRHASARLPAGTAATSPERLLCAAPSAGTRSWPALWGTRSLSLLGLQAHGLCHRPPHLPGAGRGSVGTWGLQAGTLQDPGQPPAGANAASAPLSLGVSIRLTPRPPPGRGHGRGHSLQQRRTGGPARPTPTSRATPRRPGQSGPSPGLQPMTDSWHRGSHGKGTDMQMQPRNSSLALRPRAWGRGRGPWPPRKAPPQSPQPLHLPRQPGWRSCIACALPAVTPREGRPRSALSARADAQLMSLVWKGAL